MKVTIRNKPLKDGVMTSLYLDYYPPVTNPKTGKITRREFLDTRIFIKPTTSAERTHNKQTLQMVELIRSERQIDIQARRFGFLPSAGADVKLLEFADGLKDMKTAATYRNIKRVYKYLARFVPHAGMPVADLTIEFCEGFRNYLLSSKKLSKNSGVQYYLIFTSIIKAAKKANLLPSDFSSVLSTIKLDETHRNYLSIEELRMLNNTPCMIDGVKNASMFSALTGLRHIDITRMVWSAIRYTADGGHTLTYIHVKTGTADVIPLSVQALAFCGERGEDGDRVFTGMVYNAEQMSAMKNWVYAAGIRHKITFHCFRHTFATLQLTLGTDIYTVSKLLGHKSVVTTAIYGHIINAVKRAAVDKIKL